MSAVSLYNAPAPRSALRAGACRSARIYSSESPALSLFLFCASSRASIIASVSRISALARRIAWRRSLAWNCLSCRSDSWFCMFRSGEGLVPRICFATCAPSHFPVQYHENLEIGRVNKVPVRQSGVYRNVPFEALL